MDEQSDESKEKEVIGEGIGESGIQRNWYRNEVAKETQGVDFRDQLKLNEMGDQLF